MRLRSAVGQTLAWSDFDHELIELEPAPWLR